MANISVSDITACKDVYTYIFKLFTSYDLFISRIWDLFIWPISNMVIFRSEVQILCGVIFNKCINKHLFTTDHVFTCLSINFEVFWYYVWMTTCHRHFYFWVFIIMFDVYLWCHVDFIHFQCSSFMSCLTWFYFLIYVFIFLVVYYYGQITVSIRIPLSAKVNNFVLPCSLARTTYEMDHPWCLSLHWCVLRTSKIQFLEICINPVLSKAFV